jgi:hypothetical protein
VDEDMLRFKFTYIILLIVPLVTISFEANAQNQSEDECNEQCQATRDSQDPTAAINGVFFSNEIGFGPVDNDTSYNLQIQPIATVAQKEWGNLILRGVIPVLGVPTPTELGNGLQTDFGLSDTIAQALFIPSNQRGPIKFAIGPQVSLATHTDDTSQAAGWGGGIAAAGFGFAGRLSYGALVNHLWGEDDFSTTTLQPIVFYNVTSPGIGEWFFGYNNSITYDWSAESGNRWTVPIGGAVGKTFILSSEQALTFKVGAYSLVESPEDGSDWELTLNLNVLF